jgi:hypothetical protein
MVWYGMVGRDMDMEGVAFIDFLTLDRTQLRRRAHTVEYISIYILGRVLEGVLIIPNCSQSR